MENNPLGKDIKVKFQYDPYLLFFISREEQRKKREINTKVFGYDVWNIYELSWLNKKGKPEVRRMRLSYSCNSEMIVESKSLKLYLTSFAMTKFSDENEVMSIIKNDLSKGLNSEYLDIKFYDWNETFKYTKIKKRENIDSLDLSIDTYKRDKSILITKDEKKKKKVTYLSNLLKTNCPITGQPDWATVVVECMSDKVLDKSSLLKYIVSFREEKDYHETCAELIFSDIYNITKAEHLVVKCHYTRRGGIDINPIRSTKQIKDKDLSHFFRQ